MDESNQIIHLIHNPPVMAQRIIVAALLIPIGVLVITVGGWLYAAILIAGLAYAAWEYSQLFAHGGYHPSPILLISGVTALVLARQLNQFSGNDILFGAIVVLAMGFEVIQFERQGNNSALDFNITLGGILYLGWLGAYYISLRTLPDGLWWVLLVLPTCWIADGAAYFIGIRFGKHKLTARVSPNKSWEGYFAGVVFGTLGCLLLASLWHLVAPAITPLKGLILGLTLSVITPLGDLGESMLKRGFGVKDTSHILPGHGGIMDRIDSWLWAGVIGYYMIVYLFA